MEIRPETPADRPALYRLIAQAFGRPDEADLVMRLRRSGVVGLSLVAADGPRLVGQALCSVIGGPMRALALAPVSVAPDRQGEGIARTLIRATLAEARAARWQAVFVLGNPDFYGRYGFDTAAAAGFDCPYAGPYFMVAALEPVLPVRSGWLAYPAAFAGLS